MHTKEYLLIIIPRRPLLKYIQAKLFECVSSSGNWKSSISISTVILEEEKEKIAKMNIVASLICQINSILIY